MHSYCPDLWNGFTIIKNGDIFNCCLLKPLKLGNIHRDNLQDLINCADLIELRKKSLIGKLECYAGCNFVRKNINLDDYNKNYRINYEDLSRLHISFGELCNIRCVMCRHPDNHKKDNLILDSEVLTEKIDISPFEDILLQGGEPLCIKSCLNYMDYLASKNKKYMLLTNGLLIDKKVALKLVNHAKSVIISINAATKETHEKVNRGSNFKKILSNISLLNRYKKKLNSSIILFGRMTITIHSLHEIPLFIDKYREFGFDLINFGYDRITVPQYLEEHSDFQKVLRKNVTKSLLNSNIYKIDLQRLYQLNLIENTKSIC